ncbi:MAG: GYD domain-containing protein [archaeon]|nr:GYD domain-containing protein [archaeon]
MPLYIVLINLTQKGIENIKNLTKWSEDARKVVKSVGGETKAIYFTMGRYDIVSVIEAPNDEAMTKILLTRAREGHLRTETLKAISADEMINIVKELP